MAPPVYKLSKISDKEIEEILLFDKAIDVEMDSSDESFTFSKFYNHHKKTSIYSITAFAFFKIKQKIWSKAKDTTFYFKEFKIVKGGPGLSQTDFTLRRLDSFLRAKLSDSKNWSEIVNGMQNSPLVRVYGIESTSDEYHARMMLMVGASLPQLASLPEFHEAAFVMAYYQTLKHKELNIKDFDTSEQLRKVCLVLNAQGAKLHTDHMKKYIEVMKSCVPRNKAAEAMDMYKDAIDFCNAEFGITGSKGPRMI
ncbi:coat protein [Barleria chlorosis-associated virus]|uniref:Coat protein n=1 Tax=Barleria chlorosis-associated virus TaxID=3433955 RepID=A0AC61MZI8_9VIRU|nr:coat protein [Barleria severe mosaic virus]